VRSALGCGAVRRGRRHGGVGAEGDRRRQLITLLSPLVEQVNTVCGRVQEAGVQIPPIVQTIAVSANQNRPSPFSPPALSGSWRRLFSCWPRWIRRSVLLSLRPREPGPRSPTTGEFNGERISSQKTPRRSQTYDRSEAADGRRP
jgi:hypothetical protein